MTDPDGPREQRGVMITGENPMIVLYRPGTDEVIAIASVWTCTWSPAGVGHALVLWTDDDATGLGDGAPVGIYTDNPALGQYVWTHFYRDYDLIHGRGVDDIPPRTAQFTERADSSGGRRIVCTAGTTTIQLEWRDVLDVVHVTTWPTGFEVSVVAAPCASGTITVDGRPATGEVHHPEGWFKSSAFLAFAETWIAVDPTA